MTLAAVAFAVVFAAQSSAQQDAGSKIADESAWCAPDELTCIASPRDELRRIVTFVHLVSERNRRRLARWGQRLPSASYELVRRIHPFPYLPGNDTYGIGQILLTIDDTGTEVAVRYRKHPDSNGPKDAETPEFVTYAMDLADLMPVIDRELLILAKYRE